MLNLHSVETFGTHEGPGIRLVLFTQGCNYRCVYCHNPDTIPMKGGKEYSNEQILELVSRNKPYFGGKGGITVSGGESLLQAKNIEPIFRKLQHDGIHTGLDTNGSVLTNDVKKLLKFTDLVLLDIKHFDSTWHEKVTKRNNEINIQFIDYLREQGIKTWIRYVFVPGYTDQDEYIKQLGEMYGEFENIERIELLPYHTLGEHKWELLGEKYELHHIEPPKPENVERAKKILETYFDKVYIRG